MGQFHRSAELSKMTIACDIPTQMIVDDSLSSSSSSPEQPSNLAEVMKARRRKKKKKRSPMVGNTFNDLYKLTGQGLFSRSKILKEIEIYHLCRGEENIIQLIEYF